MNIDPVAKIALIALYSLFSVVRIEHNRRVRRAGYKTLVAEKRRYVVGLGLFICYEVLTLFIYILSPERLAWSALRFPDWLRIVGAFLGALSLLWFVWIYRALGNNLSARVIIKDQQYLVTHGPYRWVRHPMYTAFYLLHIATFLLTANWFIGMTWISGLTAIVLFRVGKEEAMLRIRFGGSYSSYMKDTGCLLPRINGFSDRFRK